MAEVSPRDDVSLNDLGHYRTRRIASAPVEALPGYALQTVGRGPVLKSLDAVLRNVLDIASGGFPRALLVAATSPHADATEVAIFLARALVRSDEPVVLVDLTRGPAVVSGPLGMPRVPGFFDLIEGRARFCDVVRLDTDTALQVIASGNPVAAGRGEPDRFMRVFEALTQAYGCVVFHADLAAMDAYMTELRFELPLAVAVLPRRGTMKTEAAGVSAFGPLGCPVLGYRPGPWRRSGRFGRSGS